MQSPSISSTNTWHPHGAIRVARDVIAERGGATISQGRDAQCWAAEMMVPTVSPLRPVQAQLAEVPWGVFKCQGMQSV